MLISERRDTGFFVGKRREVRLVSWLQRGGRL